MRSSFHKHSRRTVRQAASLALAATAGAIFAAQPVLAGTEVDVNAGATAPLDTGSNYSTGTLPTATSDVTFTNSTYTTTAFTLNTTALSINSLNDLDANAQPLTITGSKSITLNGGTSDSVSGVTGDLIYVASGASLTLATSVILGNNGNFDTIGSLSISTVVSGAFSLAATGSGTLTLSNTNTFGGSGDTFTVSSGTVFANKAQALGLTAGGIVITGGTLGATATTTLSTYTGGIAVNGSFMLDASGVAFSTGASAVTLGAANVAIGTSGTGATTIAGAVSGTSNLTLNVGAAGGLTLSGAQNEVGTITNSGAGAGTTTISGIIGTNVTGVVENSATSALILSGANTFSGPVNVQSGTLVVLTSASALGTGTVTLGLAGTAGTPTMNSATLNGGSTTVFTNPIVLAANDTGTLTVGVSSTGTGVTFSGGVTGVNNLVLNNTGTPSNAILTLSGGSLNNSGSVTNISSAGASGVTISAPIGANVTGVTQNSATSALILSGINTNYAGTTTLMSGTLTISSTTALGGGASGTAGGALVIDGGTLTTSGVTTTTGNAVSLNGDFSFGGTSTLTLPTGAVSLGANADTSRTITFATTGTLVLGGVVSNATGSSGTTLIKAGATGILDLANNANTFSNLTINGGEVLNSITSNTAGGNVVAGSTYATATSLGTPFGTGSITINAGTLSAALNNTSGPANGYTYLSNNIVLSGNGTLLFAEAKRLGILSGVISGAGQLTLTTAASNSSSGADDGEFLSNTNTYTGGTILNGNAAGVGTYDFTVANAVNALGGGSGGTGGVVTFAANQYLILTANQSIAGLVGPTASTNALVDSYITGYSTTVAPTLTLNTASGVTTTFAGSIGGTNPQGATYGSTAATLNTTPAGGNNINLVVTGTGTQVLSGANSYTGTTTITGATLSLTAAGTNSGTAITGGTIVGGTSVGTITVNTGGMLQLAANYTVNPTAATTLAGGTVSLSNTVLQGQGAALATGAASGTNLNGFGTLTLSASSTLAFAGASGTIVYAGFNPAGFTLNVTGTNFGSPTTSADGSNDRLIFASNESALLNEITFNGVANATEVSLGGGYFEIQPIPEPATWAGLFVGSGLMLFVRRRLTVA